jgi:hypothetical protein
MLMGTGHAGCQFLKRAAHDPFGPLLPKLRIKLCQTITVQGCAIAHV